MLHAVLNCLLHAISTGQRATKLPVLFQPYLLQVMYMTFQYLTVSCIPAIGHVPITFLGMVPDSC